MSVIYLHIHSRYSILGVPFSVFQYSDIYMDNNRTIPTSEPYAETDNIKEGEDFTILTVEAIQLYSIIRDTHRA